MLYKKPSNLISQKNSTWTSLQPPHHNQQHRSGWQMVCQFSRLNCLSNRSCQYLFIYSSAQLHIHHLGRLATLPPFPAHQLLTGNHLTNLNVCRLERAKKKNCLHANTFPNRIKILSFFFPPPSLLRIIFWINRWNGGIYFRPCYFGPILRPIEHSVIDSRPNLVIHVRWKIGKLIFSTSVVRKSRRYRILTGKWAGAVCVGKK